MAEDNASVPTKCLECSEELRSPIVCQGCRKLYPVPKSVDYFTLLGVERSYDLDLKALDESFVSISRHVHPDFFASAADQMKQLSVRLAAELNDAVKVLKDPVLRAAYMLELSGGQSAEDDRRVPPDVLAEAMSLREEIEEADEANDVAAKDALRERIQAKREELVVEIGDLARSLADAGEEKRVALRQSINSVKYYDNLLSLLW